MTLQLKPSQWVNFIWLLFAVAGGVGIGLTENFLLGIPILIWFCRFLVMACWIYKFDENTDTIIERKGVFTVETVEIHYFRIKSIKVTEPFLFRIVGLSNVEIITSEPYKPLLLLYGITCGPEISKFLKENAAYWREKKGVKETDFHHF